MRARPLFYSPFNTLPKKATMRAQAERFGAEMVSDDVTSVDFSSRPFKVYVGETEHADYRRQYQALTHQCY